MEGKEVDTIKSDRKRISYIAGNVNFFRFLIVTSRTAVKQFFQQAGFSDFTPRYFSCLETVHWSLDIT